MQGKLFEKNYTSNKKADEDISLKLMNTWIQEHSEIFKEYLQITDIVEKEKFVEKIEKSLIKGRLLIDSLSSELKLNKKPSIPLSGMNRFSSGSHEPRLEVRRNSFAIGFKAELATKPNAKKIPLPSRTYLKKN